MTLTFYKDNTEIMSQCVLWWQGRDQTTTGFPILPSGVTATPAGTWANDLSLGNNKSLKTFDGSTNYISLTDNDAWYFGSGNFAICFWTKRTQTGAYEYMIIQSAGWQNMWAVYWNTNSSITFKGYSSETLIFDYCITLGTVVANWIFVALIRSGTTLTPYVFYTSGVSAITGTTIFTAISTNAIPNISAPLIIGCWGTALYTKGNLKDLMIFKGRALTQPEITTLMRMTNPNTGREFELLYPGQRGVE